MRLIALLLPALLLSQIAHGQCSCWIEPDASYTIIDNNSMWDDVAGFNNADDGALGPIVLPFTFQFWGQDADSVYINTNGNLTFGTPTVTYNALGFPVADTRIIAPFWGDVDLRVELPDLNRVSYKLTPTALYVTWHRVGYYSYQVNKLNSFQVVITDGNDPAVPGGNNVGFCYRDMQWTTGSASGGIGGFGGAPANVGANSGDPVDTLQYAQIGRFDHPGVDYGGPFADTSGISWLDSTHFVFSTAGASGVPPIFASQFDCDTIVVGVGGEVEFQMIALAGGPGQLVGLLSQCATIPSYSELQNVTGELASITSRIVPELADVGYHTVSYTAQNDLGLPLLSSATLVVRVVPDLTTDIAGADDAPLTIAPNPSSGRTWLQCGADLRGSLMATIIDTDGRTVQQQMLGVPAADGRTLLDLEGLPSGVYQIMINDASGARATVRLMVE